MQPDLVSGVAHLPTAGHGNPFLLSHNCQERRWDIKVILGPAEGSIWLNAGEAEAKSMTIYVPLVLGGTGYYRVNYDTDWWREIAEILRTDTDKIDPMNRAQVTC